MRDNGLGHLTTIELDREVAGYARAEIAAAGLEGWVEIVVGSSLNFRPQDELQFALLDSDVGLRAAEFEHFYDNLTSGAVVVFHDTAAQHVGMAESVKAFVAEGSLDGSFLHAPRGLFIGTVRRPSTSAPAKPAATQTVAQAPEGGRSLRF
jgi:hypothetical protein